MKSLVEVAGWSTVAGTVTGGLPPQVPVSKVTLGGVGVEKLVPVGPGTRGGVTAVMVLAELTWMLAAVSVVTVLSVEEVWMNCTTAPAAKLSPLMVMGVPPLELPELGTMLARLGFAAVAGGTA